tara:strand:+ start:151822 stop:152139 length:318 start_codon:yes stop_codon:yes gene_type:complete
METLFRLLILGLLLGILWALYMYQEHLHEQEDNIQYIEKNSNIKNSINNKNNENIEETDLEEMSSDSLNFDISSNESDVYKRDSMVKSIDSDFMDDESNANSLFA